MSLKINENHHILSDFKCIQIDRFEDDILEDEDVPLYNGETGGYAFVDEDHVLTTNMEDAVDFVGIVGKIEVKHATQGCYKSITENAFQNKRTVITRAKVEIPMTSIKRLLQSDGCEKSKNLLKLKCKKIGGNKLNIYYSCGDKITNVSDNFVEKDTLWEKSFDLGRFVISDDRETCLLLMNRYIIHPYDTSPLKPFHTPAGQI